MQGSMVWTAIYMMEQQADLPDYVVTEADRRLDKVYGHHPHSNAGTHLPGGVEWDKLWQGRWLETMQLATTTYTVPKGQRLKFIHDWQCTNSQKFKFTKSEDASIGLCPCCKTTPEDHDHALRCPSQAITHYLELQNIHSSIEQTTSSAGPAVLWAGLAHCWLNHPNEPLSIDTSRYSGDTQLLVQRALRAYVASTILYT